MKKSIVAAVIIIFSVLDEPASASNWNTLEVTGVGVTAEYARSASLDDGGCYLSFRGGLAQIISGFVAFDAGYRFRKKSFNFKGGVSGMFAFVGVETGFAGVWNRKNDLAFDDGDGSFSPGMYAGLTLCLPDKYFAVFISLGGNFYFKNHENEFYLATTALVNLAN